MNTDIRPATRHDLGFICSCLLKAARKGHFFLQTDDDRQVHLFKQHLAHIVSHAVTSAAAGHVARILTIDRKAAGTALTIPGPEGSDTHEIYALAILADYQGRGLGSWFLDQLLLGMQKETVIARCAPVSEKMFTMFMTRGFRLLGTTDEGFRVVQRDNLARADM